MSTLQVEATSGKPHEVELCHVDLAEVELAQVNAGEVEPEVCRQRERLLHHLG